jgi:predicted O-methyltransferase YrrM
MKEMKSVPLNNELYNYILDLFVPEDELLDELLSETEKLNIPLIQVSPDQARLLYLICKMIKAKKALEIGTLTGYSGIHIARGLTDSGKMITIEKVKAHAEIAEKYFKKAKLEDKVEIVNKNANDYLDELIKNKEKFDLIFIDADKKSYPEYFKASIKLSHTGTILIFDNALKHGMIIDDKSDDEDVVSVRQTNELMSLKNNAVIESLLIPSGDGFTIGIVR